MKVAIIGEGSFGKFLYKEFLRVTGEAMIPDPKADTFILAVPFTAYEEVAKDLVSKYGPGIHVINVCSIQNDTTDILFKYIDVRVGCITSIHPLFGERSSKEISDRISIVTFKTNKQSNYAVELFSKISMIRDDGLSPINHDRIMAKTHLQVVKISEQIQEIVSKASDVPDYLLTPSFKKMKEMANQFLDMTPGTKESILANKY